MYSHSMKIASKLLRTSHRHRIAHSFRSSATEPKTECLSQNSVFDVGYKIHDFMCKDIRTIDEYNMRAILLEHERTKTKYLHLERDDPNNVFSIAFRTTPDNSKGVPHILEHTVLCGSELYPVRDPFFKMLNRSLATFMNAMTGSDFTFYPFSSQNEVDFKNLQRVYLDAVFKPNLTRLDFMQEGWRLEYSDPKDRTSKLEFKGVVYNEMKGAFSETNSLFGQKFLNKILPDGTYGVVSGGDPKEIPNLTHQELVHFHKTYYHPSNARIYSYGNFPLEAHLKLCNEAYLSKYDYKDPGHSKVKSQPRWLAPQYEDISCRYDQYGAPLEKQNQIAIGYLTADIKDIYDTFVMNVLSELMVIGPNSEFYKSLIEKNISGGYNGLTGYDNQIRDTLFTIGLKDIDKQNFNLVKKTVHYTLQKLVEKGFEKMHVESVLHGYELSIKHQSPKFGLNLLFNLTPLWNHDGDILSYLHVEKHLEKLKTDLKDAEFLKKAVKKHFLDNKHRLIMTLSPDMEFEEKMKESENRLLTSKIKNLADDDKLKIYEDGLELANKQKEEQNLEVLPCLKIDEITLNKTAPKLLHDYHGNIPVQYCEANTNGLTYFKGVLNCPSLSDEYLTLLPLFHYVADKFDVNNYNYRDFDKLISRTTSGLTFSSHISKHFDFQDGFEQGVLITSHCLTENLGKMFDVWKQIFDGPNFENVERLDMLSKSYISSLTTGVIDSGHSYAMQACKALISDVNAQREKVSGLRHILDIQELIARKDIQYVQESVKQIASEILSGDNLRAAIHYSKSNADVPDRMADFCNSLSQSMDFRNEIKLINPQLVDSGKNQLHVVMKVPVNFCAKAINTVQYTHKDFAKLRVLSRFLTSKYLHPVVREQNGAYGGGAVLDTDGLFTFYSYRDPNSSTTLKVFDESDTWVRDNMNLLTDQTLFESKLSILQGMDQPVPEYMKGVDFFLSGLSYEMWKNQRQAVLEVTKNDILEVSRYIAANLTSGKCVLGKGDDVLEKDDTWVKVFGPDDK